MKWLTDNFGYKIMALLLAVGLWLYVGATQTTANYFPGNIPLQAINVPSGLVPIYDTDSIRIRLTADQATWKRLSADSFRAILDLNGLARGTYTVPVQITTVEGGVQVVEKSPAQVLVRLEPVVEKTVAVTAKIEGTAGEGYVPGEPDITPSQVKVRGPKAVLDELLQATVDIKLNGETSDIQKNIPFTAFDANGKEQKQLTFEPDAAKVNVPIAKSGQAKTVGIQIVTSGKAAGGAFPSSLVATPATVEVTGPPQILKDLTTIQTSPVSIEGASATLNRPATLVLPAGVKLVDPSIKVTVGIQFDQPTIQREMAVGLDVKLPPNAKLDLASPSSIKVVLSGPADLLSALSPTSVTVAVDVSNKPLGTVVLDLKKDQVVVPNGVSILSVLPSSVQLQLSGR